MLKMKKLILYALLEKATLSLPNTMGTVPTDIIFAGSTFLLYSYSSKNFPANGVNETNATGSALSHTICSKDIC